MLKQKRTLFNIFAETKCSVICIKCCLSTGIFELMDISQLGVSGILSYDSFPHVLCCFIQRNRWAPQRRKKYKSFI